MGYDQGKEIIEQLLILKWIKNPRAPLNLNQSKFGKYYENKKVLLPTIKKQKITLF